MHHSVRTLVIIGCLCQMAFTIGQAQAQEACLKDLNKARADVAREFGPELQTTGDQIKKLESAGLDPSKYIVEFEGKLMPITVKFYILAARASEKRSKAENVAAKCTKEFLPYRTAADLAIIYETYGLSLVLPPEMTRIDFAEILKNGKPLGGDKALVPKARDDMLKNLGIGGDAAKIIKDPKCIFGC